MKWYFIRHAESEENARHAMQHDSVPLSALGAREAKKIASALAGDFAAIISSTMPRAISTAKALQAELSLPLEYIDDLKEVRWPSNIIGRATSDPFTEKVRSEISATYEQGSMRVYDEETYDELKARALSSIRELERIGGGRDLIIVTHGDIMKLIMSLLVFGNLLTPTLFQRIKRQYKLSNGSVTLCECAVDGLWKVMYWNKTEQVRA